MARTTVSRMWCYLTTDICQSCLYDETVQNKLIGRAICDNRDFLSVFVYKLAFPTTLKCVEKLSKNIEHQCCFVSRRTVRIRRMTGGSEVKFKFR